MSTFTSIGPGIWRWPSFRKLERNPDDLVGRGAKLLWFGLYTAPEAKLVVPGMFLGSVRTMSESLGIGEDYVRSYLDRLIEDELVEYDIENRVLRMTSLPDCKESPRNGRAILSWWRRFQTVPECRVRDAHVSVLRWILDEWSRQNGKPISNDHAVAWSETFGRVSVPPYRRKSIPHIQTSLFLPSLVSDPEINNLDTNKCSTLVKQDPDTDQDQDLRDQRGGSGGEKRPVLTVLDGGGFDARDLVRALAEATSGKFPRAHDDSGWDALGRAISAASTQTRLPGALAALREYIARGMSGFPKRQPATAEERMRGDLAPEVITSPGWLALAIQHAMAWKAEVEDRTAMFAAARRELGHE